MAGTRVLRGPRKCIQSVQFSFPSWPFLCWKMQLFPWLFTAYVGRRGKRKEKRKMVSLATEFGFYFFELKFSNFSNILYWLPISFFKPFKVSSCFAKVFSKWSWPLLKCQRHKGPAEICWPCTLLLPPNVVPIWGEVKVLTFFSFCGGEFAVDLRTPPPCFASHVLVAPIFPGSPDRVSLLPNGCGCQCCRTVCVPASVCWGSQRGSVPPE